MARRSSRLRRVGHRTGASRLFTTRSRARRTGAGPGAHPQQRQAQLDLQRDGKRGGGVVDPLERRGQRAAERVGLFERIDAEERAPGDRHGDARGLARDVDPAPSVQPAQARTAHSTMIGANASILAWWNTGAISRRCLRHSAPPAVNKPFARERM